MNEVVCAARRPLFDTAPSRRSRTGAEPHVLCVGGDDHHLRIPFLRRLYNEGYRVTALTSGDASPFDHSAVACLVFRLNRSANPMADMKTVVELGAIISELKPSLIQTFDTKPNFLVPLASWRASSAPVVRTINGLGWLYSSPSMFARTLRPAYRALNRVAARRVSATVFQNRDDEAFFRRHGLVGASAVHRIAGSGVDIEQFEAMRRCGPSSDRLRVELDLGGGPVVITVTRLMRVKGIPTLLEAAAIIHGKRPDVRFVLVGPIDQEGPQSLRPEEIERHHPYVVSTGRRSDVPSLLGLAAVFAFPTRYREGIPRVLLEAALAGLPIVTTAMPGCTDVVTDGRTGCIVPEGSAEALASRILSLLDDRPTAIALGARAAELVKERFGIDRIVSQYASLYRALLTSDNRGADNSGART
jgi:glycosyltransferase involved in cell wall biosynthesis